MANEVEIRVSASDRTGPAFASVRRGLRDMVRDLKGQAEGDGGDVGNRLAHGLLSSLKDALGAGNKSLATTAATAFSAQFIAAAAAALASGAAKLAHGFAAGLALLPAAAGAAGLAVGALKVALSGVGDALSAGLAGDTAKFNEALQGLAPSAQAVIREVAGMKGQLDGLKSSVQESFFAPLVDSVRPLAENYLPTVQAVLSDIARTFGQVTNGIASFFTMPGTTQAVTAALLDMRDAVTNIALGLGSLVQAFVPLVTVGASFLPGLTDGFGGATARLAAFMQEAERTGALAGFIQGGIDKMSSLRATAGRVRDAIGQVVARVREFAESSEGSALLGAIMETLRAVAEAVFGTLQRVAGIVGRVFAPHLPAILDFVHAFADLKAVQLDTVLDALEPILMGIGAVLGTVVIPALTALANWLADNQPVLQGIGIAILTLLVPAFYAWATSAAAAAAATLIALGPVILVGAAIAALAALIIIHWDTIKAATAAVWDFMFGVIKGVFDWIVENWPLLLVILTGPIGAAVALIVTHWDTIKNTLAAVWNWISENWPLILGILTGPIGWAVLAIVQHWETIKSTFTAVKDWIADRVDDIVDAILSIPSRILGIGGAIKDKITSGLGGIGGAVRGAIGSLNPFAHGGIVGAQAGGVRGGLHMVGEHGRELVRLPAGSRVHGNAATEGMMRGGGGAVQVVLSLDPGMSHGLGQALMEAIRYEVRATSGGNVQSALGAGA